MMDVDQLLFDLYVYSGNGYGYVLTCDAIHILIPCGEDRYPTLKELHRKVRQQQPCSYSSFLNDIAKISQLAWKRNPKLLNKYAHRELEKAPTAKEFIDILYTYILRNA